MAKHELPKRGGVRTEAVHRDSVHDPPFQLHFMGNAMGEEKESLKENKN
jgi:hypothetical protein